MKNFLSTAILIIAFALIIGAPLYISMNIWSECRADGHSFFYCWRMM